MADHEELPSEAEYNAQLQKLKAEEMQLLHRWNTVIEPNQERMRKLPDGPEKDQIRRDAREYNTNAKRNGTEKRALIKRGFITATGE